MRMFEIMIFIFVYAKNMNKRCAILPASGDPFILLLFYKKFIDTWQDEVDRLYICYNASMDTKVVEFLKTRLVHPKVVVEYVDHPLGHGEAVKPFLKT